MKQKLKSWLPFQFFNEFQDNKVNKYLEWDILCEFSASDPKCVKHEFRHKHVYNWCVIIKDGNFRAVIWNENPSIGWSFSSKPISSMKLAEILGYMDNPIYGVGDDTSNDIKEYFLSNGIMKFEDDTDESHYNCREEILEVAVFNDTTELGRECLAAYDVHIMV